ncbi:MULTISPECIES: hypothetical protein [Rhodonellum]|nr:MULTISPECIES: hypothetical protein [Rhodonellum]
MLSTFAMFGALGSENEWPGLIMSSVVWIWFIWSISENNGRRRRKDREREELIEELLRRMDRRSRY